MPALQTQHAVALVHEAQDLLPRLPEAARLEVKSAINAVVSVVVLYLRYRAPEVSDGQFAAVEGLQSLVNALKGLP